MTGTAPILDDAERRRVLVEFNDTARPLRSGRCIHELISDQAALGPTRVAARFMGTELTYRELDDAAARLARRLAGAGVGPGSIVGVCLERSLEVVVALLGVLKAGGAYLPLDPGYPEERLSFMVEDAGIAVLVTAGDVARSIARDVAVVVRLDEEGSPPAGAERVPGCVASADDIAYVIYTSGSTGRPKGVLVEHGSVVNLADVVVETFGLDADSRVLQFASYSFDASVTEILVPLTIGATVHLAPREVLASGPDLLRLLEQEHITAVTLPPSLLAVLPDAELAELTTLCSAGEACHPDLVRRWGRGRRFVNGYGPTEATVAATYHVLDGHLPEHATSVPIGAPIANVQVYVLDTERRPVPIGCPGEIYIGGAGVARGYLGRPELTAERFVEDTLSGRAGARLYRTGDRARWLPDGTLDYLGRLDDQVKLRGYRIELGEIEQALVAHPLVSDAAVVVREDAPGNRRLVAYAVASSGGAHAHELRDALRASLPSYMVPAVVLLDALPLSPNGKVDRAALPRPPARPEGGAADPTYADDADDADQSTPIEQLLLDLWNELLGTEDLTRSDDLFDAGADSLIATKAAGRLRAQLGVELPIPMIFESPTVAGISRALLTLLASDGADHDAGVPAPAASVDQAGARDGAVLDTPDARAGAADSAGP